ncbi:thylakoid-associated protein [Oxynema aestuarii]|jgi:hypothetical protein|uniref:Thylakoid-associated protein n=1 Tax=Oxynema aestuarii AP17 TaxID=2064643 RepID=A0A6H1TXQ1_9CYAN|nr:thylakoid-associated protein [Oxynema aestuarii]QIZ71351.1 thylakoid-associated protein [Oxynema aestuarii AP17]RMH70900.1 MAG: thylakoid-associated protein [Cyanobacteria bacterium J007]
MDTTKYFEEYQNQLRDWQKKFFDAWMESLPTGTDGFKFPENMDRTIETQEQLVNNYLKAQETATKIALESQKQFWDGYFKLMRKVPTFSE